MNFARRAMETMPPLQDDDLRAAGLKRPDSRRPFAITSEQFGNWLQSAERGESIAYGRTANGAPPTGSGMGTAWHAYERGLVALVQKRVDGEIEYRAQRTWTKQVKE